MLGLCKCCLGYSSLEEKKYGAGTSVVDAKNPEIFDLQARLVSSDPIIVIDEPTKQNSSFAEDDSGACCHDEGTKSMSREISGENVTISSSLLEDSDLFDRVQLTVSSVNTVLEDLPETEDEHDYEEKSDSNAPLLPQVKKDAPIIVSHGKGEEKIILMRDKNPNADGIIPTHRTTFRVIRTNRHHYQQQQQSALKVETGDLTSGVTTPTSASNLSLSKCPAVGSNNALFLTSSGNRALQIRPVIPTANGSILPGSKSASSSRHNSGDSSTKLASVLKNKHCVSITNNSNVAGVITPSTITTVAIYSGPTVVRDRERSPCVSFGTDVVYVESEVAGRQKN